MKLSRTRGYKISMGNYESLDLSATISIEDVDILSEDALADLTPDEVLVALNEHAHRYLDQVLESELQDAAEVSQASASMLIEPPPPPPPPRRMERTTSRTTPRRRSN